MRENARIAALKVRLRNVYRRIFIARDKTYATEKRIRRLFRMPVFRSIESNRQQPLPFGVYATSVFAELTALAIDFAGI